MKNFRLLIALLGMGVLLVPLAAESLSGRDIVNQGTLKTLTGTLAEKEGEWYLRTPDGGELKNDVTAVWIKSQNQTYKFRDTDGTPLWSGNGQRRNRNVSGMRSIRNR